MAQIRKKQFQILCIHGHHQNAQRFREKTGSLRKTINFLADFGCKI
jgi:hypothetical protein